MRWREPGLVNSCSSAVIVLVLGLFLTSCGTGIETSRQVTDRDVRRVMEQGGNDSSPQTLEAYIDSLPAWKQGKRFWVTDNKVSEMLQTSDVCNPDTLHLVNHVLCYSGCVKNDLNMGDKSKVDILFQDEATGQNLVYRYGRAVETSRAGFSLPLLIDLDMVDHVARQVVGKDFYIKTSIWYDRLNEQMMDGRHFIKVHIDSVLPGNSVLPLRVLFTTADTQERAMVWMSDNPFTMLGRDFDALFTGVDPHLSHPDISDANWDLITRSQVVEGMTKEECRLSLGSPKRINENPDQAGLREYWYYDGGAFLFFVDGLLNQFRK